MKLALAIASAFLAIWGVVRADDASEVHGRVVDQQGRPLGDVAVSYFWSANGPFNGKDGKTYDFSTPQAKKVFRANHGKMFPLGDTARPTRTGADGRFSIRLLARRHHLLAIDHAQKTGALVLLSEADKTREVTMRLEPLIRLKGVVEGPAPGQRIDWPTTIVNVPDDPNRPLDMTRLVIAGTEGGEFLVALPPGKYVLNTNHIPDDGNEIAEAPDKEVTLTPHTPEVDLGAIRVAPYKLRPTGMVAQAKAAGTWNDYTKHFGEKPPRWHAVDARGIDKSAQLADFKGKWVMVYFWNFACNGCLAHGIPNLVKFYEDHRGERHRFEIIAFCVEPEGKIKSMADVDKQMQPLVDHVWGKPLPFPVMLDPTFATWERFGVPGSGTVILIDPEGRLVRGDETVLAAKLKH